MVDSGDLYDGTISGGRLGVLHFGGFPMIWSNLQVDCLDHLNLALHFDGIDDYVELDDVITMRVHERYLGYMIFKSCHCCFCCCRRHHHHQPHHHHHHYHHHH